MAEDVPEDAGRAGTEIAVKDAGTDRDMERTQYIHHLLCFLVEQA